MKSTNSRQTGQVPLSRVVAALEAMYPPSTALSWDRVGLVTGDLAQPVRRVHFAVDPTAHVIAEARESGADLLVTHHPLLLRGVHSVATVTAKGRAVTALIVAGIALYAAHTNADAADPGVCDALAHACGLLDVGPLSTQEGQPLGRVGTLAEPTSLRAVAQRLAAALPPAPVGIRVSGPAAAPVTTVAVLGGSGDGLFDAVRDSGADLYVTADLRHHPALEAREEAAGGPPYLIDAGHWASEQLWLADAAAALRTNLGADGDDLEMYLSTVRTDPWDAILAGPPAAGWAPGQYLGAGDRWEEARLAGLTTPARGDRDAGVGREDRHES
ncbi:MAG TPA: Nif3-like dinuclear metal center hexameric protein [Dermatophilaceae bacterium]|nr:Nif3-like dinuclear metal center hexameric protein [Dermatophilaceae bacterium]